MIRALAASVAVLCAASGYARFHKPKEAPVDSTLGVPLASRIPCDGATNPEDQVSLATTFSPGGWERSFRIEVFEDKYCKRGDLGWACVQPGHALWQREWSAVSGSASSVGTFGLSSCDALGSKEAPRILLTGWYKKPGADAKQAKQELWKQVQIRKTASRWETYEFTDPNGGTASIELVRR